MLDVSITNTLFLSAMLSYTAPTVTLGSAAGEVGSTVLQIVWSIEIQNDVHASR
jgi:hypothetical protein